MDLHTILGRVYVHIDGSSVAIMERSPFTGEYCYGLRTNPGEVPTQFRPPFTPTRRKTARAAAKVVAQAIAK